MKKEFSLFGDGLLGRIEPSTRSILAKRFTIIPFSVLNAREGAWQKRKRAWLALGIQGASGRFDTLGHGDTSGNIDFYQQKRDLEKELGNEITTATPRQLLIENGPIRKMGKKKTTWGIAPSGEDLDRQNGKPIPDSAYTDIAERVRQYRSSKRGGVDGHAAAIQAGYKKGKNAFAIGNKTEYEKHQASRKAFNGGEAAIDVVKNTSSGASIFDPVLCELVYRWFCKPGGRCLDPFCGGSINGIVGTALGYRFVGIDTRPEQIAANIPQAERLGLSPKWICGDSEKIDDLIPKNQMFDLIWTDPPYFDLEIYGGSRNDGSMYRTFPEFLKWYRRVLSVCVERLKENRFAAIKVGEVRGKDGAYLNFIGETIKAFARLGLHYYNEIILVTAAGSLPIRTTKQFQSSRKIGKTHQNVLVFWKGDPREIKNHYSKIQIGEL